MSVPGKANLDPDNRDARRFAPPEMALFRDAQAGDRAAFGQIVRHFQDRIYNSLLRITGDSEDARDLTQDTFTQALSKVTSFRGDAQPYTWLFRIALNLAVSEMRKVKRQRTFSLEGSSNQRGGTDQAAKLVSRINQQDQPSPPEAALRRERQQQVLAALGKLDPDQRALLVMRDVDSMDYQQMADILELPLGTLKSRLFRSRLALREQLKSFVGDR